MNWTASQIVLASVVGYLVVCIAVGAWALRRTKSTRDFFMAGRNLGVVVTAFAIFSSTMSGFGFVGGPGLVYAMGSSSIWIFGSAVAGGLLLLTMIAKRIRLIAEVRDCISLPDVVAARYGSDAVRVWVAVAVALGVLGYLATQILAMAIVVQGILREANVFPGISLELCVVLSSSVLVFYTVTGGIIASVYTDLIQGAIMLVASLLVFATVLGTFDGGMTEMTRIIATDDAAAMGPWGTMGMAGAVSWFFIFGLGLVGQPHVVTKYMMVKRVRDLRHVVPLGMLAYAVTALLWLGIGLAMRALVVSGAHPSLATPDAAAPEFLQNYAHPLLAGAVFAALLAAIMSTADGFLNIGTAALVHDIPKGLRRRPLTHELLWARVVTVALAVTSAVFALYTGDLVALLGAFGFGTFAAALVPVVAIGLNWKRATPTAAVVAIASSLAVNFGVKITDTQMPHNIDVGAASLVISLVLFLSVSLATKPVTIDRDIATVMDM